MKGVEKRVQGVGLGLRGSKRGEKPYDQVLPRLRKRFRISETLIGGCEAGFAVKLLGLVAPTPGEVESLLQKGLGFKDAYQGVHQYIVSTVRSLKPYKA